MSNSDWNNNDTNDWDNASAFGNTDTAVEETTETAADAPEKAEDAQTEDQATETAETASEAADSPADAAEDDTAAEDSDDEAVEVDDDEVEGDGDNWITDDLIQDVSRFSVKFVAADKNKREFLREVIRPRRGARAKKSVRLGVSEIVSALVFGDKAINVSTLFLLNSLSKALNPETQDFVSGMEAIEIINETEADDLRDLIAFVNDAVLSGDLVKVNDVTDEDHVERLRTGKTSTPAAQLIDSISKAIQKVEDPNGFFGLVAWSVDLTGSFVE